jgi:single-strand DNA-binding protein
VSKIVIIGNVGRDPELRMTSNGRPVCEFSVAVNRVTGRADGGDRQEQTDWYRVSCWANLAERAQQVVTKGRQVYVEGRFSPRTYTDREGKERMSLDINANDFQILGPRPDRGQDDAAPQPRGTESDKSFDPDEIPF